ncbi:hypothetical protein [Parachitinimonas caeni]|uniref:Uncharacterized protein n=1 Tax=Parachitinimonas caeni TaxID=3031301 RepID=A0ABT7DZZ9_9NEIS|nr:hypothetical protein [Parachitinimonas caeni]MDK2125629.1 hypothetical protein [Parachitinimonas caeni]
MKELIEKFSDLYAQLYEGARSNSGIDEDLLDKTKQALLEIREVSRYLDCLPKSLVNLFVDMQAALMSCADRHEPEMAKRIFRAADVLSDIARDIAS